MDFKNIQAVTFDCYGTLIDWESGILSVLRPWLERNDRTPSDEEILRLYSELEPQAQSGGWQPYRAVLRQVTTGFASHYGFALDPADAHALADSLRHWEPFDEAIDALYLLKQYHRLAVVSNIDEALFAETARHLQVEFDAVVTAEHVKSYKPGRAHFEEVLRRLNLEPAQVLHVAESLFHDIVPAQAMGFRTVWVNRHAGRPGATRPADAKPGLEVPDLLTLAQKMGLERSHHSDSGFFPLPKDG